MSLLEQRKERDEREGVATQNTLRVKGSFRDVPIFVLNSYIPVSPSRRAN